MEALATDQSNVVGGRQTDIGTIPDGWDVQPLSQLLDFQNGFNAEKSSYGSGVPFANVLEVITKSHLTEADIPGCVAVNANQLQTFLVRPGDILFNRTSETQDELGLASVYVGSAQIIFGGFVIRGRIKSNRLNATFAGYVLRAPAVRGQIVARGQGAVRANIGQSELGSVMVSLPPPHEQAVIAEALADADGLIEELEQVVLKKRQIKQGVMQELLSGQRRLPGFSTKREYKQTEVGIIPKDWHVGNLGELCSMKSGEAITSAQINDGSPIPCYGGNGIRGFTKKYTHDGHYTLVGRQGALCGNVVDAYGKFYASEHAIVVDANSDVNQLWLSFVLRYQNLNKFSESSAQPGLSVAKLLKVRVSYPPTIAEQQQIAIALSDMEEEITAALNQLAKVRFIKQGMIQELLTGRVRLV